MPVYKIAAKRVARKQREDANGISALKSKMREMGEDIPTDSDESGSDSDADEDDEDEDEDESEDEGSVLSDEADLSSDSEDEGEDGELEGDEDEEEEDEDEDDEEFTLTIAEVAGAPLWPPTSYPQGCVVCPDRLFKNEYDAGVHLGSNVSSLRLPLCHILF
jgi:cobalamin biosynthesis protein CobT